MPSSKCRAHRKPNYNGEVGTAPCLSCTGQRNQVGSCQLLSSCWWVLAVTANGKNYCFVSRSFYYQQTTNPPFLSSIEWSLKAVSQVPPRHACLTQQEKCWQLLTSKYDRSGWIWKQGAPWLFCSFNPVHQDVPKQQSTAAKQDIRGQCPAVKHHRSNDCSGSDGL